LVLTFGRCTDLVVIKLCEHCARIREYYTVDTVDGVLFIKCAGCGIIETLDKEVESVTMEFQQRPEDETEDIRTES